MKNIKYGSLILVLILSITFIFGACQKKEVVDGQYASLAQCLTEKGVKFYGTYWCSHCRNQKKMFGDDLRYVDYVECDPQGENSRYMECLEADIKAYPSWFFPGQGLEVGEQSLDVLAKKANCEEFLPGAEKIETTMVNADGTAVEADGSTPAADTTTPAADTAAPAAAAATPAADTATPADDTATAASDTSTPAADAAAAPDAAT